MVGFTSDRIDSLFKRFAGKRVAVIGDLMVDRYFWGSISRISPEAPVPVVEVASESTRLGGAANVANNIASLGGTPIMVGVIGQDNAGALLRNMVQETGFPTDGLVTDSQRPTTIKTRVIAHHQHVVRIDQESKNDIDGNVRSQLVDIVRRSIKSLDAIILEDYNKGVISRELIHEVISLARQNGTVITVDPKFNNFFEYQNVTVFKPNRKESEEALGRRLTDVQGVETAGRDILGRLKAENVLLTLGEQGMSLFEKSGAVTHVSTQAMHVSDVSGAGDTVISTLTMALVSGATIREASSLANYAGGVVCGEVGIVPIQKEALAHAVMNNHRQR